MQNKNRVVAGILALLFGAFGIHKFYLGQVSRGILYLLFFWTGIPGGVGFMEGVIYLTASDNQFSEIITSGYSGFRLMLVRLSFFAGLLFDLAIVAYIIIMSTQSAGQYFLTVQDLQAMGNRAIGRELRVSGAVLGETISFDSQTFTLSFVIVNIPYGAETTESALNSSSAPRLKVVYVGPKPDLLKHGSQVIVEGQLGGDGIFHARLLVAR